jgi:hypothetical protein
VVSYTVVSGSVGCYLSTSSGSEVLGISTIVSEDSVSGSTCIYVVFDTTSSEELLGAYTSETDSFAGSGTGAGVEDFLQLFQIL